MFDSGKKIFVPDFENCHLEYKGYNYAFPLDNGGSPFCVFYKKETSPFSRWIQNMCLKIGN